MCYYIHTHTRCVTHTIKFVTMMLFMVNRDTHIIHINCFFLFVSFFFSSATYIIHYVCVRRDYCAYWCEFVCVLPHGVLCVCVCVCVWRKEKGKEKGVYVSECTTSIKKTKQTNTHTARICNKIRRYL
jgi:hypothetical protein